MGCTSSISVQDDTQVTSQPIKKLKSQRTRIIQEDEVDVCINDEYDVVNNKWAELHGAFLAETVELLEVTGAWKAGLSAGGSRNDLELFSTNPQYLLALGSPNMYPKNDEIYLPNKNFSGIDVSFCLTQTMVSPPLHIAFFIYRTDNMRERLSAEYFLCIPPEIDTGAFVNWRQVHQRFRLPPGLYVIIPATFNSGKEGTFKLIVKAPPPVTLKELPPFKSLSRESSFHAEYSNGIEEEKTSNI